MVAGFFPVSNFLTFPYADVEKGVEQKYNIVFHGVDV